MSRQRFLRLGVKGRILDERIDEDPQMILDLEWLDDKALLSELLLDRFHYGLRNLINDVVNVTASLNKHKS